MSSPEISPRPEKLELSGLLEQKEPVIGIISEQVQLPALELSLDDRRELALQTDNPFLTLVHRDDLIRHVSADPAIAVEVIEAHLHRYPHQQLLPDSPGGEGLLRPKHYSFRFDSHVKLYTALTAGLDEETRTRLDREFFKLYFEDLDAQSIESDEIALQLGQFARDRGILEQVESNLVEYVELRTLSLLAPYDSKGVEAERYNGQSPLRDLAGLLNFSTADFDEKLRRVRFLKNSSKRSELGFTDLESLRPVWEMVTRVHGNTGVHSPARGLFLQPDFVQEYQNDERAKVIVVKLIADDIARRQETPNIVGPRAVEFALEWNLDSIPEFDGAMRAALLSELEVRELLEEKVDFVLRYLPERKELLREDMLRYFQEGCLESAERVRARAGLPLGVEDVDEALHRLARQKKNFLATGSLGGVENVVRTERLLEHYREYGIDIDRFPTVVVPEGYHGKILTVMVDDQVFIRSGRSFHKEILGAFRHELSAFGYDLAAKKARQAGGAWLKFKEDNIIEVFDASVDFGECDKELAVKLVADAFPDYEVVGKPA